MIGQQSDAAPRSIDEPLPTIATDGAIALTTPIVIKTDQNGSGNNSNPAKSVDEPLQTVVSKQNAGLISSFVLPKEGIHKGNAPRSIEQPIPTVTAEHGAGYLVSVAHGTEGQENIDRRAISPDQPLPTQCASNKFAVVNPRPSTLDPRPCIVSTRHGAEERTADPDKPLPTVTTKGEWAIATPFIVRIRGTDKSHIKSSSKSVDDPLDTVSTTDHHALVTTRPPTLDPFITKYFGTGIAVSVEEPLDTVSTRDRFLLVNPQTNEQHEIEIFFRLLKWKELAAAHSFPEKYKFKGNKSNIVKQIGNSNPIELTAALTNAVL